MLAQNLEAIIANNLLYAIIVAVLVIIIIKVLDYGAHKLIKVYWKKKKFEIERKIVAKIEHPLLFILLLVAVQLLAARFIGQSYYVSTTIQTIYVIVVTFIVSAASSAILEGWSNRISTRKNQAVHEEVTPLIKSTLRIIFGLIALVIIMAIWGIAIAPLLGGLGIAGAIIGFAFKDTLENIFSGIAMILDDTFRKGDWIQLENEDMGQVVEITLRATHLKTFDDEVMIIPNGKMSQQKIINFAQPTPRLRITIPVSVSYGSDPDKVHDVLLGVLKGRDDILKYPRREVRFIKMNEYSLDFQLIFFIHDYKTMWKMRNQITTECYKALYRNGLEVPFPARTIYEGKPKKYDPDHKSKNTP